MLKKALPLLTLLLLLSQLSGFAQGNPVTGKVTGSDNVPMAGVSIQISGTTQGAISDVDGNYRVEVPANGSLIFSFIGYKNQTVPVNNRSVINVVLESDATALQEVVVTALGIKKDERKLGYSVSKVGGEVLNVARESNVANSLSGRVSGLNVAGTSGGPGSSARINIRGVTSFSGSSSPLIVINGVPMDNSNRGSSGEWGGADQGDGIGNINPDDIETMTVLKGSTASALYGSRAANGVIQITTKSGLKGKTTIEYNTNLQFDKAIDNTDWQYEYGQGTQGVRPVDVASAALSGRNSWGERLDGVQTIQSDGQLHPYSAVKNNIENFYRTAASWTNTVAISGGSDRGTYRLSLANLDGQSILRNSGLDRKTVNFNTSYELTKKLSFNLMVNYIDQKDKNRPYLSDAVMNANNIAFLATNVNQANLAPGYNAANNGLETAWSDDIYATNPWFVVNKFKNDNTRRRLISAISARYQFFDFLSLQARVGYDFSSDRRFTVFPYGTLFSSNGEGSLEALYQGTRLELNTDALLSFSKNINEDFSIDASVGGNFRRNNTESTRLYGGQFIVPYLYTPTNTRTKNSEYLYNALETPSVYYTADFSYKFLTLSTTGRYDTFSSLPRNNRSLFTPSVSASFVFSDLLNTPALNYGKLRVSYAETSGEPAQPYQTAFYFNVNNPINGIARGSFDAKLPNANLKPFSLNEFEVGTEMKFLDNRLGLDVTYFNRQTKGEIVSASLSSATGFTSRSVNLGSTLNRGVELMVSGTPVRSDFTWNTSFNFTKLHNEVLDIDQSENPSPLQTGTYRPLNGNIAIVKGLSIAQVMAYDYKRDANGNVIVGTNGVPVRGALKPMGSGLPNLYGGWNNDFSYKNFNLSFLIDFKYNNKILSATEHYSYIRGLNQATLVGREEGVVAVGVKEDGSVNDKVVPAYTYYPQLANNISAVSVLDGSFIKFRQLTLGYTFTPTLLTKTPFQSIGLSLVGRNLFTLLKHTDNIDPENTISSLVTYAGVEGGSLPFARTYGFTVNVKFK